MSNKASAEIKDFGASFKSFMQTMTSQTPEEESAFALRFRQHFRQDPTRLPVVSEKFELSDHPNLQVALDSLLAAPSHAHELVGMISEHQYLDISLSRLVAPTRSSLWGSTGIEEGPVQYVNLTLEGDRVLACVGCGVYFIRRGETPIAVLVRGPSELGHVRNLLVEVMAADRASAEKFLGELRQAMRQRNVYRGRVVSLSSEGWDNKIQVHFHRLPEIRRDDIILPDGLLDRIERQTVRFGRFSQRLLDTGRHLKRGVLLHGPPGTGKTFTAMYLIGQMRERTVLLLTGRGLGLVEQSCKLARLLAPSVVILEDVDLIAEERERQKGCSTTLLFELLNEMDGLANDVDVLFLLTTNRPDILEPALAARPGRVDQAIEVPLPDARCRKRLFELYGQGLTLRFRSFDKYIERTEGVSAAFIRELLRKAALIACDQAGEPAVEERHLDEALHELLVEGGQLTKSLLGAR